MELRRVAVALPLLLLSTAHAQYTTQYGGCVTCDTYGGGCPPTPQSFRHTLGGLGTCDYPGHIWVGFNAAETGLGYEGSYMTIGGLTALGDDIFEGTIFLDGQAHLDEYGRMFANLGIGRRQYIDPVLVGVGVFGDFDGSRFTDRDFVHDFAQVGVSLDLIGDGWEARGNGYFPVGDTDFTLGNENTLFFGNNILVQNGIDSALRGVDGELGVPIPWLQQWQSMCYIGGYHYDSDSIMSFGGVSLRLQFNPMPWLTVTAAMTDDNTFGTNGILSVTYTGCGSRLPRGEASLLNPFQRNDHIVRFNQEGIIAINPETNQPWNAIHVDNSNVAPGTGTAEDPYTTLADAQNNSNPNDLIYVRTGAGAYSDGIVLQDTQFLLGDGVDNPIPTQVGQFVLPALNPGGGPVVSNGAGAGVVLATDNVVRGFDLTNNVVGITTQGSPQAGNTLHTIDQVDIDGGTNGVIINSGVGTYTFTDTNIGQTTTTGATSLQVQGAAPTVNYGGSITNTNGFVFDVSNTTGGSVNFSNGGLTDNGGTGANFSNVDGDVNVSSQLALNNSTAQGLNINGGDGTYTFSFAQIMGADGEAVMINGGDNTVTYTGTIDNSDDRSVVVTGKTGGTVTFNATVMDTGTGIDISNNNAGGAGNPVDVVFNNLVSLAPTNVDAGDPIALLIENNDVAGSSVQFNSTLNIDTTTSAAGNQAALRAVNNDQLVINSGTIDATLSSAANPGVLIQDTNADLDASFTSIDVNNAAGTGIQLEDNINGAGNQTNLGVVNVTNTGGTGLLVQNTIATPQTVTVGGGSQISTTTGRALDVNNAIINMNFNQLASTNSTAQGVRLDTVQTGSDLQVATLNVTNSASQALLATDFDGTLSLQGGTINQTGGNAIELNVDTTMVVTRATVTGMTFMNAINGDGIEANANVAVVGGAGTGNPNLRLLASNNNLANNAITGDGIQLNSTVANAEIATQVTGNQIDVTGFAFTADATGTGTICIGDQTINNSDGAGGAPENGAPNQFNFNAGAGTINVELTEANIESMNNNVGATDAAGNLNYNTPCIPAGIFP